MSFFSCAVGSPDSGLYSLLESMVRHQLPIILLKGVVCYWTRIIIHVYTLYIPRVGSHDTSLSYSRRRRSISEDRVPLTSHRQSHKEPVYTGL